MLLDAVLRESAARPREIVVFGPGERPAEVPPEMTWVGGDPTKESELAKVRLGRAGAVIIAGGRGVSPQAADATTILTIFTIRAWMAHQSETAERRRGLYVVAEILDEENVDHARAAGADEVIETTRVGFALLAHAIAMPGTAEAVAELAGVGGHSVFVGRPPEGLELPLSFGDLGRALNELHGLILIGVRDPRDGKDLINPDEASPVTPGHGLVYIAEAAMLPAWT